MEIKNIAGVRLVNVVTLPHISRQRVQNHNSQLISIQKNFLVSMFLKQRKIGSDENEPQVLTNDKLVVEVKGFFFYTKFEH